MSLRWSFVFLEFYVSINISPLRGLENDCYAIIASTQQPNTEGKK
jgi:hypothetical protein